MKTFAVVLSGCGVYDGAEIHEAVLSMYAIQKNGAAMHVFAPDWDQMHVVNHYTGQVERGTRNVLCESARIARGKIKPLDQLDLRHFDALLFPGGFGVAKNLCDYATQGADCTVAPPVANLLRQAVSLRKPIGALCISPVLLAKVLGNVLITVGPDAADADNVMKMGAKHVPTQHGQVVFDGRLLLFSAPCYQLEADLLQIAQDTDLIIKQMLSYLGD